MAETLIANTITMRYQMDARKDGAAVAPVVMLSNSLMSNFHMWDDQIDALTEDFQVLRYDTRGHGGTDAPAAACSIDIMVDDALALMDALNIEKVHFVGLSMGGMIAQLLAVRNPERVVSLVLCDTSCHMPPPSLWDDRIRMAETEGVAALSDGTLERWFTEPFRNTQTKAVQKIRTMIENTSVQGFVNCARAIRDMNQCGLLHRITAPTAVIVGESDPSCPVASAEILHGAITSSRLIILENAAHLPNIEQKAAFNAALTGFLKEQAG
jgi:3-oxoadipate enol-lactonase